MRRPYLLYSASFLLFAWTAHIAAQAPAARPPASRPPGTAAPATQGPNAPGANVPAAGDLVMPPGNAQHGQYIAEHVAMCVECHSGRDSNGNILQSEKYDGAPIPFIPPSLDWATRAPRNRGLPGYTDAMAMRLLTQGAIGRDGRRLRPPMPRFRMTPQDAADVITFLRSLR